MRVLQGGDDGGGGGGKEYNKPSAVSVSTQEHVWHSAASSMSLLSILISAVITGT